MPFSTTQARKRLTKIDKEIAKLSKLQVEKSYLEQFLALGERFERKGTGKSRAVSNPIPIRHEGAPPRTKDIIGRILERVEKMHLDALMKQMKANGWIGSGNHTKDYKTVYAALKRKGGRYEFENLGRNTWRIKRIDATAAS